MLGPLYSSFFRCHIVPKFAVKTLSNLRGLLSLGCCMCSDSSAKADPPSVLSHVADHILEHNVRRILVLAGAGISTDSGIPDFRTPGSGLYDNLSQYNLPWPEAVFDLQYFYSDPVPFYSLAKELYPSGRYRPNVAHYFIRLLHEKSRLLRCYTQNIDSLERIAGLPTNKLIEAHGTFLTATCTVCRKKAPSKIVKAAIDRGVVAKCPECHNVIKPDIVFFGENLPDSFWKYKTDVLNADLVFVMGTSLEVHPFAGVAEEVPDSVPRVLFNRDLVGSFRYQKRHQDLIILGPISNSIIQLARLLNWDDELEELMTRCKPNTPSKPTSRSQSCPTVSASNNHSRGFSTTTTIAKMLTPARLASRFRALSVATVAPAPHSSRCPITVASTAECVSLDAVSKTDRPPIEPVVTNRRPTFLKDFAAEPKEERSAHYKPIPKDAWTALRQYLFPISGSPSDSDSCKSGYSFLNSSPDFGHQSDCDKPTASVSSQQFDDEKAAV
ncbi:hypothetical protein EG68_11041 [Paragonimus skrjabini miyazakii]|uniref:Deacetylase sirtuin-type domain-containing protein n=1 Tax=Paragonimus skrjabini miyazakii TaxID=59628 RepID=A0A8S9YF53_9TREM|nr:hypothetical protein EG68_11041 [Paragonimus skrjabini miyazakii]